MDLAVLVQSQGIFLQQGLDLLVDLLRCLGRRRLFLFLFAGDQLLRRDLLCRFLREAYSGFLREKDPGNDRLEQYKDQAGHQTEYQGQTHCLKKASCHFPGG